MNQEQIKKKFLASLTKEEREQFKKDALIRIGTHVNKCSECYKQYIECPQMKKDVIKEINSLTKFTVKKLKKRKP
jgi:hypothetical protein